MTLKRSTAATELLLKNNYPNLERGITAVHNH